MSGPATATTPWGAWVECVTAFTPMEKLAWSIAEQIGDDDLRSVMQAHSIARANTRHYEAELSFGLANIWRDVSYACDDWLADYIDECAESS